MSSLQVNRLLPTPVIIQSRCNVESNMKQEQRKNKEIGSRAVQILAGPLARDFRKNAGNEPNTQVVAPDSLTTYSHWPEKPEAF